MMQLIGMHDSPFVRRVAITARFLEIPIEYRQISIFRQYDEVHAINPMVKVPTLICDDGQMLVDSTLIIDYLESLAGRGKLMPGDEASYVSALGIIGTAMVSNEKAVQLLYETQQRPAEAQFEAWSERLRRQLTAALGLLEQAVGDGSAWLFDDQVGQADITAAVAWRFVQLKFPGEFPTADHPGLVAFSARAEALPEFMAVPPAD